MLYDFDGTLKASADGKLSGGSWTCTIVDSDRFPFLRGRRPMECHPDTDEIFLVIRGSLHVGLSAASGEEPMFAVLGSGDALRVPRGVWHTSFVTERTWYAIEEEADADPGKTLRAEPQEG